MIRKRFWFWFGNLYKYIAKTMYLMTLYLHIRIIRILFQMFIDCLFYRGFVYLSRCVKPLPGQRGDAQCSVECVGGLASKVGIGYYLMCWFLCGALIDMDSFPKIGGFSPQIIHEKIRDFHYFHHPFWGFYPYFWKHPDGNICCLVN